MATMDWNDEMFKMLIAIERQAILSLGNIKTVLTHNGLAINPNFKQYFLQLSYARLAEAYHYFEINSQVVGKIFSRNAINMFVATSSNSIENRGRMGNKEKTRKVDYIEIDDSDDERAKRTASGMKIISIQACRDFEVRPTSANATSGRSGQDEGSSTTVNGETRIGATVIKKRMIKAEISSPDENHQNGHNNSTEATEDDPMGEHTKEHTYAKKAVETMIESGQQLAETVVKLETELEKVKEQLKEAKKVEDALKLSDQKLAEVMEELAKYKEQYSEAKKMDEALQARDQKLAEVTAELVMYKNQYNEAKKTEEALKESDQKLDKLTKDWEKAKDEITALTDQLDQARTENAEFKVADSNAANRMKMLEVKYAQLINMNKQLMETNEKLTTEMEGVTVERNLMADRITELEVGCDNVYDQCAKMISDTKQKQWCVTCGKPGGTYYCSVQCEATPSGDNNMFF
ncbi:myosin-2 heavy chain-like [Contarinia nasturtii]|uniref:myosin-2 heavy chain-like n=1 Tax=Contarinia nasturtii TaxID=265458 RepID=UPI0012D3D2AB|nr:myosin-2 heavy chain-like [Contarinia nasturtii]